MMKGNAPLAPLPALLALVLLACAALAQETVKLPVVPWDRSQGLITATLTRGLTNLPAGSYGWIRINLDNPGAKAHDVRAVLESTSARGGRFRIEKTIRLAEEQQARFDFPLPSFGFYGRVSFYIDGHESGKSSYKTTSTSRGRIRVLMVQDVPTNRTQFLDLIRKKQVSKTVRSTKPKRVTRRSRSKGNVSVKRMRASDLPDEAWLLSGFDIVVVDGRATELDATIQDRLVEYAELGGILILEHRELLGAGALRKLWLEAPDSSRHSSITKNIETAFGRCIAVSEHVDSPSCLGELGAVFQAMVPTMRDRSLAAYGGPCDGSLFAEYRIPGLGDIPARLFFLMILLFAIVVGPVNWYIVARRLRKPLWLLVTVPVAGISLTVMILLYGIFSEGFGIQGSIRSISFLDQREHSVVQEDSRTLYAGMAPGELRPKKPLYFLSKQLLAGRYQVAQAALNLDLSQGMKIDGTALPSRLPTAVLTAGKRSARERLRFRRRKDGSFAALAGPGLMPVDKEGAILLRDFAGDYYLSGRDQVLRPTRFTRVVADRLASKVALEVGKNTRYFPGHGVVRSGSRAVVQLPPAVLARLRTGIPAGSYVAIVKRPGFHEDLGLDVEYLREAHIVFGTLGTEDFLD